MSPTTFTVHENIIIKKPVPTVGIISSNPARVKRLIECLDNCILMTEYQTAWQLDLYIGNFEGKSVFIAAIGLGASGAYFAIEQLIAAGAKYIVRYGSNDNPGLTEADLDSIVLIKVADNLYGVMQGAGVPCEAWGKPVFASPLLIEALTQSANKTNIRVELGVCHHVENYHAATFPDKAGIYGKAVEQHFSMLEKQYLELKHTRDMESAALFFAATLSDDVHVATILQNVPKPAGMHQTYAGSAAIKAKNQELSITKCILSALKPYAGTWVSETL